MGLESGTYVDDLNVSNPLGTDDRSQGDDHIRLIKTLLKNTFPNATRAFRFESVISKAAAHTVLATEARALFSCDATGGAFSITLPASGSIYNGFAVIVAKEDASANAVTVDGSGAETINGAATRSLSVQYQAEKYMWDGSEWRVIALTRVGTTELLDGSVTTVKLAATAVNASKLATDAVETAKIKDKNVTYAKVQDVSATQRLLGRNTAGAGVVEEVTWAQFMEWLASSAQGDILYRDASAWTRLAAGTSGHVLKTQGAAANPVWAAQTGVPLLHLRDEKTAGTDGGTFNSGAWQTRTINTEVTDEITSTLAANQFTLPVGTYYLEAMAAHVDVGSAKLRLRNITDVTTELTGTSDYSAGSVQQWSEVFGQFTVSGSTKTFEIQHRSLGSTATIGFGRGGNIDSLPEVFLDCRIWKVA